MGLEGRMCPTNFHKHFEERKTCREEASKLMVSSGPGGKHDTVTAPSMRPYSSRPVKYNAVEHTPYCVFIHVAPGAS